MRKLGPVQNRVLDYVRHHGTPAVDLPCVGSNSTSTCNAAFRLEELGLIERVELKPGERSTASHGRWKLTHVAIRAVVNSPCAYCEERGRGTHQMI